MCVLQNLALSTCITSIFCTCSLYYFIIILLCTCMYECVDYSSLRLVFTVFSSTIKKVSYLTVATTEMARNRTEYSSNCVTCHLCCCCCSNSLSLTVLPAICVVVVVVVALTPCPLTCHLCCCSNSVLLPAICVVALTLCPLTCHLCCCSNSLSSYLPFVLLLL